MAENEATESLSLQQILSSQNIAELLDDDDLAEIGTKVVTEFQNDKDSRDEWEERMEKARKLATQVMEPKTTPWIGASNVKFPLLTIASIQFNSRAYPITVPGLNVVKCAVTGADPEGEKQQRARRVSTHMSYQVLVEDENWEEEHDRLLMVVPITGTAFKKSYFNHESSRIVSELVLPYDLVMPYYGRFETVERKTHILRLTPREIQERVLSGTWLEHDLSPVAPEASEREEDQGFSPVGDDANAPREVLEQHRWLDLDGDGYPEPYIVTADKETQRVFRIVARFAENGIKRSNDAKIKALASQAVTVLGSAPGTPAQKAPAAKAVEEQIAKLREESHIVKIDPIEHFTKYSFIPSPDGGIYDLGFGVLLGPVNETVDTLINQLIDSGTLQNSSGGFIGRGARIKSGELRFKPFEWKKIDIPGPALKDNLFPLPINTPSPVLFQLLELMINYGERLSAVTDMMVGETPGQNTPASTAQTALDQGLKVFAGVLKRIYRAMRSEFRIRYKLNALYLDPESYYRVLDDGSQGTIFQRDYHGDPADVTPEADPTVVSEMQNIQRAQFVAARAASVPGYDQPVTERRLLSAMRVSGIDEIYPVDQKGQPKIAPPPNIEAEAKLADAKRKMLDSQVKSQHIMSEIQQNAAMTLAKIRNLEAQAVSYEAQAEREVGENEMERIRLEIEAFKTVHNAQMDILEKLSESQGTGSNGVEGKSGNAGGVPGAKEPSGQTT